MTHDLKQRILGDAHIMQSAGEQALSAFIKAQKAYDRMALDLALRARSSGQSGTINDYAQLVSVFSRFADLQAASVERLVLYGAGSVPQLQLDEVRAVPGR
ncbi:hypothetical protein EX895_002399 [Sporisorium graminicola]|uniref:Uncharacterized protein n=1 Tax=Sporisorium graminicola TaxID=280036 RepID=A0A4U7KZ93_9BASI|nr:hypothetical protein EX895_002399 [Sporisorium graminicola]TKY88768.1 hypothetical protein EX895_002399 [Sporisorium graminicola]